jgi:hypothetical protein
MGRADLAAVGRPTQQSLSSCRAPYHEPSYRRILVTTGIRRLRRIRTGRRAISFLVGWPTPDRVRKAGRAEWQRVARALSVQPTAAPPSDELAADHSITLSVRPRSEQRDPARGLNSAETFALSRTLLIFGGAHALCSCIPLAHARASLGPSVSLVPRVVIDLRI